MKKSNLTLLLAVLVIAIFLALTPQPVRAAGYEPPAPVLPAAGNWSWDNEAVTGTIIPQYQLAATYDPDYALLQSEGVHLSGGTQLCHPYPGGQFGWNAEIRVLTNTGWQPVPTVNQWVPDEEGKFMTCAQVWSSGTYAIFGYWEKPEGWEIVDYSCADLPDGDYVYVGPASTFRWSMVIPNLVDVGQFCYTEPEHYTGPGGGIFVPAMPGLIRWEATDGSGYYGYLELPEYGYYCACDAVYRLSQPLVPNIDR